MLFTLMASISPGTTISVIIPALNAGSVIARTLDEMAVAPPIVERIVVDGGSIDDTVLIAEAAGARVVRAKQGRGGQLAAGAAAAQGDWYLFLHADTVLGPGWRDAISTYLARPDAASRAAVFRFRLDDKRTLARLLERIVSLRCRLFALPYGDQALLINRALYDAVGGYKPIPLYEDVDLVRRLGRARLILLDCAAVTSAVRYRGTRLWVRPVRNLSLLTLYFMGVPPRLLDRLYGRRK
jgi:rSAM/selenodomain-associated transferase 2